MLFSILERWTMKKHDQIEDFLFMDIGQELHDRDVRTVDAAGRVWKTIKNTTLHSRSWNLFWLTVKAQIEEFRGMDYEE